MSARRNSRHEHQEQESDSRRYYDWLNHARMDLRSASILRAGGGDAESIAFHCQQCIEKALKGFLLFRTGRRFDGHNLTFLCRQAARQSPELEEYIDESAELNRYYIETRYPADIPVKIDEQQIDRLYIIAETMYKSIVMEVQEHEEGEK